MERPIGERIARWVLGAFLLLVGLWLGAGGVWLLTLGGSFYYLLAGITCAAVAILLVRRRGEALPLYGVLLLGTLLWALAEVGADFWQLLPRICGPAVIGAVLALLIRLPRDGGASAASRWFLPLTTLVSFVILAAAFVHGLPRAPLSSPEVIAAAPVGADDWPAFGRTPGGDRYAPAAQITPANVDRLKVAWTYHTGDLNENYPPTKALHTFEATPIKIGDTLYICTAHDIVIALDVDTGKQKWRFDPKVDGSKQVILNCRGVSYYKAPQPAVGAAGAAPGRCAARILVGTVDARLIALDAMTGELCPDFGKGGMVSLLDGLGPVDPGHYFVSSPPAIVGNVAVVGGFVLDNARTLDASGVVRGYDVNSGKQLWGWDSGRADPSAPLKPGEIYTPGSPNSWTVMAVDPALGLVYVPMGNATPDFVGTHRPPAFNRFSSALVALDGQTGKMRWSFQTVHEDLWDYDLGSQPVLLDFPVGGGRTVPALAQPTKRGDIFILDRRTGQPITPVVEKPVPAGMIPGQHYAPTQPFSTGFPSFLPPKLTEAAMWGATPLDQLWCRIRFRQSDYRGLFTPPSVRGSIEYPGNFGAVDWGSVSIDKGRGLMLVNSSRAPLMVRLVPRAVADPEIAREKGHASETGGLLAQKGTPYAAKIGPFLSPLGLPCNAPPWGLMNAVDLKTRKIIWSRPLGTTRDHAPLGIAVPGVFNLGGSVATAGGVTFIGATMDAYIRAFDSRTGRLLWKQRMPGAGQAAPMSYMSARSGRQYVVIAAGGLQTLGTKMSDAVVAYALDK